MFRVSQHPSSGVLITVATASGTCTATPLRRASVGFLFTLNYDARKQELKNNRLVVSSIPDYPRFDNT